MITKITGVLNRVLDEEIRLQVGPLEYQVLVPEFVRRQVQGRLGHELTLHTTEYLDGNPMQGRVVPRLIGFLHEAELEFFELFCTVDKVGVRKALKALVRPVREIANAIQRQDPKWLTTLPGVGAATAEQMIAKLKRKVTRFALAGQPAEDGAAPAEGAPAAVVVDGNVLEDAYQALMTLGLSPAEARDRLDKVLTGGRQFGSVEQILMEIYNKPEKQRMARQAVVQTQEPEDERNRDAALRPRWLREVIGQKAVVQRLGIVLKSCKHLKEPLSHILFDGPPGLGKTTFATVLPNELGTAIQMTSGPALSKPADLLPFLTNAEEGSFLFIDEIHRLPKVVEEFVYPAMEDFRIDIVLGEGINARTISMKLKHFTLIGATTRSGLLSSPMRDRFKMHEHLEFYSVEELAEIVRINSRKLKTEISEDAALEIARRSRGTPRVANARLWWARHFATSEADGRITLDVTRAALGMAEVDGQGLDKQDLRYLQTIVGVFEGGPTGVEALAATMNLPVDTLSDEVEPYLLREQFIVRTPRGRVATPRAYQHLGKPMKPTSPPDDMLPGLFD